MAAKPRTGATATHYEKEGVKFEITLPNHEKRADSKVYKVSRAVLQAITKEASAQDFMYPLLQAEDLEEGYEDHHGGGMWVNDGEWLFIKNIAGMEWSSQFCADPKKVDKLRRFAQRVYAKFPGSLEKIAALNKAIGGAKALEKILSTPIRTHAQVSTWVDSVFNANVPLNAPHHTGFITSTKSVGRHGEPIGGVHHYPTPITDIQFVKYDDFKLWVTDPNDGSVIAVTPADHRGKGDGRLRVAYATPGSEVHEALRRARDANTNLVVRDDSPVADEAYERQGGAHAAPTAPPPERPRPSETPKRRPPRRDA
jgi:hypothetical protein